MEDPQVFSVSEAGINVPVTRMQWDKQCGPSILSGHLKGHAVFHFKDFKHSKLQG